MATIKTSKFLAKGGKGPTVGSVATNKVNLASKSSKSMPVDKKAAMSSGGMAKRFGGRSK